ncbi:beta-glucosidase-like glycosyl hydrolase [Aquimarina sp. EL_43]|uniref:glycoside hydrolase family 3 protein n=1 Tax=unclassified Aquimarina TaxID=2627091 RepID=UPI0018CAC452|nr:MULTISPECIES: glycoside hydrolase family 3 N-terminal domain-containing protein [unclassified Aquimarina]MBG6128951.1 beta-glucosidase-like glycosyl hydrolase [Aquimarina sp. EL_35]MBG6150015.1 beta-glucosidase-like glycosyl hydrolase [Aquimarina sp. EL_32]MBG6167298.1 beta-glucosidase-like glycosyl hydrolase [Aquimarina sp. EL_43]
MNLSNLSKTEKIGQFFFPAAFINDTDQEIKEVEKLILDYKVGGLTFFHSRASAATNFEGKKKVIRNENSAKRLAELITHYQNIAPTPLLISIDAEWGLAMRVENTPQYPYAITLGAIPEDQSNLITEVGKYIGNDLKSIGIHLNLAPVADINVNPNNPVIGYRSFGENKEQVTLKSLALYKGLKASGVLGCFKHFPGHGDTAVDSHLGLPVISKSRQELFDEELYPFIKAIASGIDSILIGHLAVPSLTNGKDISATLSKDIIKGILRNELGFEGAVISDALNMHSVSKLYPEKGMLEWKAFDAGNDILCFAEHVAEGIRTIEKNATDQQIEESFTRVQKLKKDTFKKNISNPTFDSKKAISLNNSIAKASLTHYKLDKESFEKFNIQDFEAVVIGNSEDCTFFEEISRSKQFTKMRYTLPFSTTISSNNILIALFPPSIKPMHEFGIDPKTQQTIEKLSKTKNVTLYLFGNPYVLRVLPTKDISNIILIYQDFKTFQEIAAKHFLGQHKAIGLSPVQLSI